MSPSPSQQHPLPPSDSVGAVIRGRRQALGLSQADLAGVLGSFTTVSDIEALESSRIVMPSWIRLMHLAAALELPVEAFLGGTEASRASQPATTPSRAVDKGHGGAIDQSSLPEAFDEPFSQ